VARRPAAVATTIGKVAIRAANATSELKLKLSQVIKNGANVTFGMEKNCGKISYDSTFSSLKVYILYA
tara:strand:+ start:282 stop:485 length:204 start_codon:yes stop_codon:yes gene_type:complete